MLPLKNIAHASVRAAAHHAPVLGAALHAGSSSTCNIKVASPFSEPVRKIDIPAVGIIMAGCATISAYSKDAMALYALQPPPDPQAEAMFGRAFGVATTVTGIIAYISDVSEAEKRKAASEAGTTVAFDFPVAEDCIVVEEAA